MSEPAAVRAREPLTRLYHRSVPIGSRSFTGAWISGVRALLRAATLTLVLGMGDEVRAQTEPENLPPAPVAAPVGKDLLEKRIKVTGRWVNGRLLVTRVEQRDPRKDPATGRITGRVDGVGPEPRTLHFGPVVAEWGDRTSFKGVTPETLATGATLEVKGLLRAGRLVADSIEAVAPTDKVEMLGTVTSEEHPPDGTAELTVLGAPVTVPKEVPTRGAELARRLALVQPLQPTGPEKTRVSV